MSTPLARSFALTLVLVSLALTSALFPQSALAQSGEKIDDVDRTVEFGPEFFAGWANQEFFNSAHGGFGIGMRVKDVITLRLRNQYFGVLDPPPVPRGRPDDAWSFTAGLVLHPFKFYNGEIPDLWLEPYIAGDVGVGALFDKNDGTEFLQANFLWGLNLDMGRHAVLFFEGGVLYLDFDDKDPHRNSVVQGQMTGGFRYFF